MHIDPLEIHPIRCHLFGIQILLATCPTVMVPRGMHRRDDCAGILGIQIWSPVPRGGGVGAKCIHARNGYTVPRPLAATSSMACIAEPAEKRTEGDKTAGGDAEAGFHIGPDGDVGGSICTDGRINKNVSSMIAIRHICGILGFMGEKKRKERLT